MTYSIERKLSAEFIGTALLLAIVVGSGIMGDRLSTDDAIALLGNTLATGAGLVILIFVFGPISGAHFNPAVTLSFYLRRELSSRDAILYVLMQIAGALVGVGIAHFMFGLDLIQPSSHIRASGGELLGEGVATFALIITILACVKFRKEAVPYAVGLVITAGYWYTSSTSFANPAVTIARALTDSFAGIAPSSVPGFIMAQLIAVVIVTYFANWLFTEKG
ncbi:MAG: MIP/aquaporin family protein [bacterium]